MSHTIVVPWIRGGSDLVNVVAEGLKYIYDHEGYEGYEKCMDMMMKAFDHDKDPHGDYLYLNAMFKLGQALYAYELQDGESN